MLDFLAGANTMGFLVASAFFVHFWRRTGDGLFAIFGIAFVFFALNQALTVLSGIPREEQSAIYLLRLAGFMLLIVAIVAKNLRNR